MELKKYSDRIKSLGGKIIIRETSIGKVLDIITSDGVNICANNRWNSKFYEKNIELFDIKLDMSMDKNLKKSYII